MHEHVVGCQFRLRLQSHGITKTLYRALDFQSSLITNAPIRFSILRLGLLFIPLLRIDDLPPIPIPHDLLQVIPQPRLHPKRP